MKSLIARALVPMCLFASVTALTTTSGDVAAHNNPTFREDAVHAVTVPPGGSSKPFALELPEGTVQLLLKVEGAAEGATFTLLQGGKVIADGLNDGSAVNRIDGEGFTLKSSGADDAAAPLGVTLIAKVLDRDAKDAKKDSAKLALGKTTYKKANCVGCHKWHGGGGGGYGGAAKSLRDTTMDRAGLTEVVRCGRPGTGMPSHVRGAYKSETCYGGATATSLGDNLPPKSRSSLRDRNIDAVVEYVLVTLKGKGKPTKEECVEYWGDKSQACNRM